MSIDHPNEGPHRAHTLVLSIGADSREDLAAFLYDIALLLQHGELIKGMSGSPRHGGSWSYIHDPAISHEEYFTRLQEWLARDLTQPIRHAALTEETHLADTISREMNG